jgi:hypothetical protein
MESLVMSLIPNPIRWRYDGRIFRSLQAVTLKAASAADLPKIPYDDVI